MFCLNLLFLLLLLLLLLVLLMLMLMLILMLMLSVDDCCSQVLAVVRHKGLWFVVSMGCYMTGVGGMVFCIIRNPKPHGYHQVKRGRP